MPKKDREYSGNPSDRYGNPNMPRKGYNDDRHPFDAYMNDTGGHTGYGKTGENYPGRNNLREEVYARSQTKQKNTANRARAGKGKSKKRKTLVIILILLVGIALGVGFFLWRTAGGQEIKPVMTNPTKDVVLITNSAGLNNPVYKNIWAGIEEARQKNSLTTGYISVNSDTDKDFNAKIDEACREYRVVVCYGQDLADNLLTKAQVYPQTKFIFFEGTLLTDEGETSTLDNVLEVGFRVEEASYLAGYLAVKVSVANSKYKLGFIGGKDETALRAYYGYYAGAVSANSNFQIDTGLPGSAADSARIKFLASSLYDDGTLIIYHSVGYQYGLDIAEVASQKNKKVIASDAISETTGTEVLTTVVKHYNTVVENVLDSYSQNALTFGERLTFGYAEDALDFLKPGKDVSDTLWKQVEDLQNKIIKGQVKIPSTKDEFESKYSL